MFLGLRHQSLRRKRTTTAAAQQKRLVYGIDTLAYAVSLLSLFFTIDQVRIIWWSHDAHGVSLISWVFYTLSSVVWLVYGMIHKDTVIYITNVLWVLFSAVVVVGVVIYS